MILLCTMLKLHKTMAFSGGGGNLSPLVGGHAEACAIVCYIRIGEKGNSCWMHDSHRCMHGIFGC